MFLMWCLYFWRAICNMFQEGHVLKFSGECSIGASKYLNCLEFEKKIYFSANIISFIPSISASKQIELYEISNNFLWYGMAYYTSRPDSLLDVFQLRYFEVTELLDISNGSQTNRVKFCVARSFFLHEPLWRYKTLPETTFW